MRELTLFGDGARSLRCRPLNEKQEEEEEEEEILFCRFFDFNFRQNRGADLIISAAVSNFIGGKDIKKSSRLAHRTCSKDQRYDAIEGSLISMKHGIRGGKGERSYRWREQAIFPRQITRKFVDQFSAD